MNQKVSKETIIRTTVLMIAILNNALAMFGKSPIPIDNDMVVTVVSFLFTTASALVNWWYNNSFTEAAIKADEWKAAYLKSQKEDQE